MKITETNLQVISSSNHGVNLPADPSFHMADYIPFGTQEDYPFLLNITSSASTSSRHQHILSGTSVVVSEGSYFASHETGSLGWIITTPTHDLWIKGGNLIPGPKDIR